MRKKDAGAIADAAAVIAAVAELGVLFLSDPKRKSAIEILTGEPPRGSWWSHPAANQIYSLIEGIERHDDVLFAKLLSGKVTLIHRALWPALLAVVTAREPWQIADLSPGAQQWLAAADAVPPPDPLPTPSRTVSKELEARLLARAESVHTSAGRHETRLEPWLAWAARAGCPLPPPGQPAQEVAAGKAALAAAAARLGPPPAELPWAR